MRVCLGGTFHPFHAGHWAMLQAAFRDADEVFVGLTDGELARRPDREVPPWDHRAVTVKAFAEEAGFGGHVEVRPLSDAMGPAVTETYDAIVVSADTVSGARRINEERVRRGLDPLILRVVPLRLADDLLPVSATRVAAGDIDAEGRRLTPVRVRVGSANPVKVAGVEAALAGILGCRVEVRGGEVGSVAPEQPKGQETLTGARARAQAAAQAWPRCDYALGIEAGLNQDPDGLAWYDVQACVVRDGTGHETDGWGPAFQHPAWVTRRALKGEMVSRILGPVADDEQIGGTTGAIGFLTGGRMDRTELTRIAVLMAFVPRIRRDLYGAGVDEGERG